jgi:hypothetical protein
MNKNRKIIIGVIIALLIIVIGVVAVYKLIENNVMNRENFKVEMENISSIPVDTENLDEKEYSFFGKVIESNEKRIIVEPNENEEIRKSGDKVYVGLGEYADALYMVGTNVKITYKGTVMTTYPLQVNTTNIEIKSADNFEIVFSNKKPTDSYKVYTILSKTETDKYDYTIYGYDGIVNINIDGKDYLLKDALLQNKITMDEIIAKANKDLKDKKITGDMYADGGSMIYKYENYTIIKCHTLDGNRDVYIGNTEMAIDDVI